MSNQEIKIAIADDHKIFRDGIRMSLKDRDYLKILWEAEDGKDLMHKLQLKLPDVILMDIRMPEVDGINAISLIRKEYEALKIIVLTTVSYTHLRAHETPEHLVCRLLLEKKNNSHLSNLCAD